MTDIDEFIDPMDMGCELYTRRGRGHWVLIAPFPNTDEAIYHGRTIQRREPDLAFRVRNDENQETHFEDAIDADDDRLCPAEISR